MKLELIKKKNNNKRRHKKVRNEQTWSLQHTATLIELLVRYIFVLWALKAIIELCKGGPFTGLQGPASEHEFIDAAGTVSRTFQTIV